MAEHVFAGLRCADVQELAGAFVLGALPEADSEAVREHLAACPEAHAEVAELGSVVPVLFETVEPVAPPDGLRERILAAAEAEAATAAAGREGAGTAAAARAVATAPIQPEDAGKPWAPASQQAPREDRPTRRGWNPGALLRRPAWAGIAMASLVAVVALGAWNLQLQRERDGLAAYRAGVVEVLEEATRPGTQLAVLTAPQDPAGPSGLAAVGADGSVALVMRDLAPTTGMQVYETWLIGPDEQPIPIGHFTVDASRTASFVTARAALGPGVTVALSLEPRPGATTPSVVVALGVANPQAS